MLAAMKRFLNYMALLLAFALLMAEGCSRSAAPLHKSVPITGRVTVAGKPLREGMICIISTDNKSGQSAAEIKNGDFATNATLGSKRVEIIVPRNRSLAIYRTEKSPLQADVKEDGKNHFEFNLTEK